MATKLVDITGQSFGLLTVISRAGLDSTKKTTWNVLCKCGNSSVATGLNLKNGTTKSCGCLKHRKGEDNPKYRPIPVDVKKERKRAGAQFRHWRKSVLERCPVCVKCGNESNLHVHHIKGSNEHPEFRFDPLNGVTFCADCHIKFHVKYGRKKGFSESDAEEFVDFDLIWLITRHNAKGGIDDLKKARHYLDKLIELETPHESSCTGI